MRKDLKNRIVTVASNLDKLAVSIENTDVSIKKQIDNINSYLSKIDNLNTDDFEKDRAAVKAIFDTMLINITELKQFVDTIYTSKKPIEQQGRIQKIKKFFGY